MATAATEGARAIAEARGAGSTRPPATPAAERVGVTRVDGEIAAREFLGDPAQFSALDADGDGYLSPAEAIE